MNTLLYSAVLSVILNNNYSKMWFKMIVLFLTPLFIKNSVSLKRFKQHMSNNRNGLFDSDIETTQPHNAFQQMIKMKTNLIMSNMMTMRKQSLSNNRFQQKRSCFPDKTRAGDYYTTDYSKVEIQIWKHIDNCWFE